MTEVQKRVNDIAEIIRNTTVGYLRLGALLAISEEKKDYKKYKHKSMTTFLADMFQLKPARYYQIRQVYDYFGKAIIDNPDLANIEFSRLRAMCPLIKGEVPEDAIQEMLHTAKTLPTRDFIAWVAVQKGKPDQLICEHDLTTVHKCKKCHCTVK